MVQNQSLPSDPLVDSDPIPVCNTLSPPSSDIPASVRTSLLSQSSMEPICDISAFYHQCQSNNTTELTNENSSLIGNTSDFIPNMAPELFNGISTSLPPKENLLLDNSPATGNLVYLEHAFNTTENSMKYQRQEVLDNVAPAFSIMDMESASMAKSRMRLDSTESIDTLDSSSSGEIFSSSYTDTISSVESSTFLMKPTSNFEEESQEVNGICQAACNDGYMSCSSTEILNDYDNDDGNQEDLISLKIDQTESDKDTTPMPSQSQDVLIDINTDIAEQNVSDYVHHTLSPIKENEIISFVGEEVEPSQYTKITDNIIIADESFLFNSTSNLGDVENGQHAKLAGTMHNLFERASFLDLHEVSKVGRVCQKALVYLKDDMTLGSLASLNTIVAKEASKDPTQSLSLISGSKSQGVLKRANYMKNLIALSMSITLLYIAIGSVRNLQSSINHEGGVGVIGLAVNFVGYVVGSMFSSSIVQSFQPRRCIIVNLFPNLLYIAANLYPTMWVMVPMSLIQGVSLAIISNATSTYITFLAKGCAEKKKKSFAQISGEYFGIYMLIYQTYMIVGNLIASLILEPPADPTEVKPVVGLLNASQAVNVTNGSSFLSLNQTSNNAPTHLHLCGSGFCHHFEIGGAMFSVELETKLLLFGLYIGCIILALLTAIFLMEPLNKTLFTSTVSPIRKFKSQMSSLMRFFVNIKFLLLLPLLMFSAMQFAFISAEFIKGYVSCALGLHMIGYTMICFGVCSSLGSYLCGLLNKFIGRIPFVVIAAILNLGSLVFILQWQPHPDSLIPFFLIMGLWGATDGIWNTQASSLMGIIFPDNFEEAYGGLRITQGLSVAIAFGYSSALCMTAKIYITGVVCSLAILGYIIMEVLHRSDMKKSALQKVKQTTV